MVWSSGVTPAAVIRTSTLPSARRGLGTSTNFSPPYPVNDSARIALIIISPFLPFATADVSPRCHGNDRLAYAGSRFSGGDVGTLSQAAAEGNVLARCLVERDHEIIWRDVGSRDHAAVQGLQQAQSLLFGTAGDKRDLQQNQVIRIVEPQERPRVQELARRQDVNYLEEVFRRNAQCAYQAMLNRVRYLAETSLVVASFAHMDFGEGHVSSPLIAVTVSRIDLLALNCRLVR